MPSAAVVAGGSRPRRARLGNLSTNHGDGTSTAAGSGGAEAKSSLARAVAAAATRPAPAHAEHSSSSTTASSPTSAFSDQQTVLGERRRSQLLTAEGKDGPQQQPRRRQLALRVLEMHRHRRGLVPSDNDGHDHEIANNYDYDDDGSTDYNDTADDSSYHHQGYEHDDDNDDDELNAQYQDLLGRQQTTRSESATKDKSSFERMPPPPPRNADRIRKGTGGGGGAELSFVGNGKQNKERVNGGGTIASLLPSGATTTGGDNDIHLR